MSSATKVTDEDDSNDIADFIETGNKARETWRYFEPLLDGRYDGIYVARGQGLLQGYEERQKENKYLRAEKNLKYTAKYFLV